LTITQSSADGSKLAVGSRYVSPLVERIMYFLETPTSPILKKLQMKVAQYRECSFYPNVPNVICAIGLHAGHLCAGDSGGPLQWVG